MNIFNKQSQLENDPGKSSVGVGGFLFEMFKVFLLALVIFIPIKVLVFQPFFVKGASMEPNFEENQYLIIGKVGYNKISLGWDDNDLFAVGPFRQLERQISIVFRYPKAPKQYFIKRVIGLPGEKVEVKNNVVTIYNAENPDGFVLNEREYLSKNVKTDGDITIQLKDDEYFVMGDNRQHSSDSRVWGAVPEKDIIGKVFLRAWPLDKIETF